MPAYSLNNLLVFDKLLCVFIFCLLVGVNNAQMKKMAPITPFSLYTEINVHNYELYNKRENTLPLQIVPNTTSTTTIGSAIWETKYTTNFQTTPNHIVQQHYIQVVCKKGIIPNASIAIKLAFDNWDSSNYVLLPAAVYNGNKYNWRRIRYSPKLYDKKDIGANIPTIINDVPKLTLNNSDVSSIQERSGSMSTPAIGFFNQYKKEGFWLTTPQRNSWGDYGLGITETRTKKKAYIHIQSPVVRELYNYTITNAHTPSWDKPVTFKKSDTITFTFNTYLFKCNNTQAFFTKYATIRKQHNLDTTLHNTIPFSEVYHTLEKKLNTQNYVKEHGYYAVGLQENFLQDWQIGWTGGMINTYPLLFSKDTTTIQRVINNFNWLFPNGISPSGFFWDAGKNGTEWYGGDIRNNHTQNWHLVRKSGDAIWYILKQFAVMKQKNIPIEKKWEEGTKKVCDAFVTLWNKHQQLGQFVHSITGDIEVGGSCSGAIVPAALVSAAAYYNNKTYVETAKQIATYYYKNFTSKGITNGGPGDALQAFDSESSYSLVESYTALYQHTKDTQWLQAATEAATQFATWVVGYNYQYNDTTAFAKANIKTVGSVYANIQNKHASPGICTASGIALLKLYQYTGNSFYLQLLQDIAKHSSQYLPHPTKPLGNAPIGWVSERVNLTDWEGPQSIGYVLPISTWAEIALLLTNIEIPGIYVNTNTGVVKAFDNVNATVIKESNTTIIVSIENNTAIDANISVLIDNTTNAYNYENILQATLSLNCKALQKVVLSIDKKKGTYLVSKN